MHTITSNKTTFFFCNSIATILLLCSLVCQAQLKKATVFYNHREYAKAIPLFLKEYEKNKTPDAVVKLANSYRLTQNYSQALKFYKKALPYDSIDPLIPLHYYELLKNNNQPDSLLAFVKAFTSKKTHFNRDSALKAQNMLRLWEEEKALFEIEAVNELNSEGTEFSAVLYDSSVVYVSDDDEDHVEELQHGWTQTPYLRLHTAQQNTDGSFGKIKLFDYNINGDYHSGPICFNSTKDEAIFTRVDNQKKGKNFQNRPQLYISKKKDDKWQKPIPFEHNDENFSFAHPSLSSNDQHLYFVSNKHGTSEKRNDKDIFRSTRIGENWSKPVNLGSPINTKKDELFPFIHLDSILYFSSNGHPGFGGLDLFVSKKDKNKWSAPKNLKKPVNSSTDDFGISFSDSTHGYLSSNRLGGKGKDDIYFFTYFPPIISPDSTTNITGVFMYSELDPAANAEVILMDEFDNEIARTTTNALGEFSFENLKADKNYVILMDEKDPQLTMESVIFLTDSNGDKIQEMERQNLNYFVFKALRPEEYEQLPKLEVKDSDLRTISLQGQVFEKLPGDLPSGMAVNLIGEDGEILYTTYVDSLGNFKFEKLPPYGNYSFRLQEAEDAQILILDEFNDVIAKVTPKENGEGFKYEVLALDEATIEKLRIMDMDALLSTSISGVLVFADSNSVDSVSINVYNRKNKKVFETITDQNGYFKFENLPIYDDYVVVINNTDSSSWPFSFMYLTNNQSHKVEQLIKKGPNYFVFKALTKHEYEQLPVITEKYYRVGFFGNTFKTLEGDLPEGMEVYLINDKLQIVSTTTLDSFGNFNFEKLPADSTFIIRLEETDNFQLIIMDNNGIRTTVKKNDNGEFIYQKLKIVSDSLYQIALIDSSGFVNIKGQLYQSLPGDIAPGMKVFLIDDNGNIVMETFLDKQGNFVFEKLKADQHYIVQLEEKDVDAVLTIIEEEEIEEEQQITFEYQKLTEDITSIAPQKPSAENTALIGMGLKGKIYEKLPGDLPAGMKVYVLNDAGEVLYETVIDEKGNFVFEKLPPNHNYIVRLEETDDTYLDLTMLMESDDEEPKEVKMDNKGNFIYERLAPTETSLIILDENDAELFIKKGDKFELSNIYYELDSWKITKESAKELDKLVTILNKNPHIAVSLSSHTDSRAKETYNMVLSQLRAKYAVDYIVKKGIDKNRVTGVGYGETQLINKCKEGVICSEKEHAMNRRTEIRIVKKHW